MAGDDPGLLAVPSVVVGASGLALSLLGYAPAGAASGTVAIFVGSTGLSLVICTYWAIRLGQGPVACIFGLFAGFFLSFSMLQLSLSNGWFPMPVGANAASQALDAQAIYLVPWVAGVLLLTLATLRLPLAFTVLLTFVTSTFTLVLVSVLVANISVAKIAGLTLLGAVATGGYIFGGSMSVALGGKAWPMGRPVVK